MPQDTHHVSAFDLLSIARRRAVWLILPMVMGFGLAAVSTFVLPRYWLAEQGFLIRSDAAGYAEQRLGKFTDLSEMKTAQETLLELARSQSVVSSVLAEVYGQPPAPRQIEKFREHLHFTPPGGAEFGKTEVFYLGVEDTDPSRAVTLVEATARGLNERLQELRDQRAASMVAEVQRSVDVAREQLENHIESLAEFERSVGADLIELRHLTSPNGGQSQLSQRAFAIEADLRASIERSRRNEALLKELQTAISDPARLIATPDALLTSQPGLRRLKDGLVDAQLTVARIGGVRTADHPFVLAARRAESQVAHELERELPTAMAGVKLELEVAARREAELAKELESLRSRSGELASKRSRYAELSASVESQSHVLEGALQQLADAEAHRAGAMSASLLAPIDSVETGVDPIGPSRKAVAAAGAVAGLLLGAALVFLLEASGGAQAPVNPRHPHASATPTPAAGEFGAPGVRNLTGQRPTPESETETEDPWLATLGASANVGNQGSGQPIRA